jgi:N-carbamoylputrescine amidase
MRVTVCELPQEPGALDSAWGRLCDHTAGNLSELVLLPEFAFADPVWVSEQFDESHWIRATQTCDAWLERLHELDVDYVVGTRPVTREGNHFNEGFMWTRNQRCLPLRRKYFMPDEPGGWEAHWFTRGDSKFPRYSADSLSFGLNICSEIWALETYAEYASLNIHAVMCPRATEAATTAKWRSAGIVAAVRAGAFCLSSNRAHPGLFGGAGWIIGPDGDVFAQTSVDAPFSTLEIDPRVAEAAQSTYPRYALGAATEGTGWNRGWRRRN